MTKKPTLYRGKTSVESQHRAVRKFNNSNSNSMLKELRKSKKVTK
ncbi:gp171.1 [Bacillus phage W.Ph.]|uniref:Gp171.1 n=1 Tax=Bacillus phage W.Ph. TaxID=764595 RepID=L7UUG2_9CAUD|nr:gp171.1 [Bacillus phage W.Ph.]AGC55707.1 gp171.1 [Bacillus phage W.Ph.]